MIINGGHHKDNVYNMINNKKFKDLSINFKKNIKIIFPNIKNNDIIYCKKINSFKIDFAITVGECTKNISIKCGSVSVILKEHIHTFLLSLCSMGVSNNVILALLQYFYADGTIDGSGKDIYCGELLKEQYAKEIALVQKEFENKLTLEKIIDYILINDKNGLRVDYFYYGNDRVGYLNSSDFIKDQIVNEINNYPHDFMRIGPFNFLPLKRKYANNHLIDNTVQLRIVNFGKYFKEKK